MPGMNTSKPYHYGSHYSNSGIVLHFLVRIPPFTNMFLDFQGMYACTCTSTSIGGGTGGLRGYSPPNNGSICML